ncbi:hypothetical protein ABK046_50120, partial [Streptomyces caeruleatus]
GDRDLVGLLEEQLREKLVEVEELKLLVEEKEVLHEELLLGLKLREREIELKEAHSLQIEHQSLELKIELATCRQVVEQEKE